MGRKQRLRKQRRELLKQQNSNHGSDFENFKLQTGANGEETVLIQTSGSHMKMSGALIAICQPFLDDTEDFESKKSLLMLGAVAWNMSLVPSEKWTPESKKAVHSPDILPFFEAILANKRKLYPDSRRCIQNVDVNLKGTLFEVNVASSLDPNDLDPQEKENLKSFLARQKP